MRQEPDAQNSTIRTIAVVLARVDEAGQLTPYMLDYIISRNRLGKYNLETEKWPDRLKPYNILEEAQSILKEILTAYAVVIKVLA